MEEAEFRRRAPELESALGVPSIQRVLEGRLPLAWEAALMLGCCAAPAPHAASRDLGDTFSLKDLVVNAAGHQPALPVLPYPLHLFRLPMKHAGQRCRGCISMYSRDNERVPQEGTPLS